MTTASRSLCASQPRRAAQVKHQKTREMFFFCLLSVLQLYNLSRPRKQVTGQPPAGTSGARLGLGLRLPSWCLWGRKEGKGIRRPSEFLLQPPVASNRTWGCPRPWTLRDVDSRGCRSHSLKKAAQGEWAWPLLPLAVNISR